MTALLIALGAAVGAPARYLVARQWDSAEGWPWGTLAVNLLGSAFLGWLVGHGVGTDPLSLLGTGFCGALTTYSAVSVQSVDRGRSGLLYAAVTVSSCLAVAALGYTLG